MIPQFPEFKHVEVNDREAVEAHTHKYEPYSDFNFTSLWAWDTSEERMISVLNDNLVVRFTDYSTHEPFLSFLGTNETEHTARTLIDFCRSSGLQTTLKLVPEISVKDIRPSVLKIEEDRDNFDYIYSIPELSALRGTKYMTKRTRTNKFRRENPEAVTETIDLANAGAQLGIQDVISVWENSKVDDGKEYDIAHERTAIERICKTADSHALVVTGVFIQGKMRAFSIDETLQNPHSISHFWKSDNKYAGIYDLLMQEKAKHLETLGAQFMNFEQDLGIDNLRINKSSYRPVSFLKKYIVQVV